MKRPENLKAGEKFRVIEKSTRFDVGDIITLKWDDGTYCPFFWKEDKSNYWSINFSNLEPVTKSIKDAPDTEKILEEFDERFNNSLIESVIKTDMTDEETWFVMRKGIKKFLITKIQEAVAEERGVKEKYQELIMAVEKKYQGESRHETALKYIRSAEKNDYGVTGVGYNNGGGYDS